MSVVLGKNVNIYVSGDYDTSGLLLVGCEETCTVTFNTETINTTVRGRGRARGREYGLYDITIQSTGVVFANVDVNPSTKHNPLIFSSLLLEGKKVVVKWETVDGGNTFWNIGKFLIQNATYTGGASGFGTYDVTLINDGDFYQGDSMITSDDYDSPASYLYSATGASINSFVATPLINAAIFFIHRSGVGYNKTYLPSEIQNLPTSGSSLSGGFVIGFHAASGTIKVSDALSDADLDKLLIVYNQAD